MKCLVVCPSDAGFPRVVRARGSTLLLPLIDRPFLQHVVERLVGLGVSSIELLVANHPDAIEALVGDGSRWGCRAAVHLLRDTTDLYSRLRLACPVAADEGLLLVHGDRLPGPGLDAARLLGGDAPVLVRHVVADAARWTGWAWLPPGVAGSLNEALDEASFGAYLAALPGATTLDVDRLLEGSTVANLLAANRAVLDGAFPELLLTGREVEPGVWLSRNVILNPRARVTPPVHLGENARVGASTQVGPYAVLGRDSILDDRCHVEDAVVAPGSYVGQALDLVGVLVDRNVLVSAELGVATTVTDRFILGSLRASTTMGWGHAVVLRLMAFTLLLVGWPLLVAALIGRAFSRRAAVWHTLDAVTLPAEPDEATWRTQRLRALASLEVQASRATFGDLVLRVLPLLPAVLRGRLSLVGVPPRSSDALCDLPDDWREVVLRGPSGVIWEAHVVGARSEDERRAAETYYVAMPSLRHDLALVGAYLRRALSSGADRPARPPGAA